MRFPQRRYYVNLGPTIGVGTHIIQVGALKYAPLGVQLRAPSLVRSFTYGRPSLGKRHGELAHTSVRSRL